MISRATAGSLHLNQNFGTLVARSVLVADTCTTLVGGVSHFTRKYQVQYLYPFLHVLYTYSIQQSSTGTFITLSLFLWVFRRSLKLFSFDVAYFGLLSLFAASDIAISMSSKEKKYVPVRFCTVTYSRYAFMLFSFHLSLFIIFTWVPLQNNRLRYLLTPPIPHPSTCSLLPQNKISTNALSIRRRINSRRPGLLLGAQ